MRLMPFLGYSEYRTFAMRCLEGVYATISIITNQACHGRQDQAICSTDPRQPLGAEAARRRDPGSVQGERLDGGRPR